MQITINNHTLAIGEQADASGLASAKLCRPGLFQRLLRKEPRGGQIFDVANCTVTCFGDDFRLYPCTHGYLTHDRQWRTAATILVVGGRVESAVLRVIDGKYAASEFVARFRDACTEILGAPHVAHAGTSRWRNGSTEVLSLLQPDGKNACFLFETK